VALDRFPERIGATRVMGGVATPSLTSRCWLASASCPASFRPAVRRPSNRAAADCQHQRSPPAGAGIRPGRVLARLGKNPAGNRRRARRGNRRTCVEAPDHPVRARGFGAARIYYAAGTVPAGLRGLRIGGPPAFCRATAVCQSRLRRFTPRERRPAGSAVIAARVPAQLARWSFGMAARAAPNRCYDRMTES
jgi:hypothetical protein